MMIQAEEHFYDDDPSDGHPDVRTRLKNAAYFFLGNGHILAAVQVAPSGEGTPVGLLIMNPEKLGKKREALSFDPASGLEATQIRVLLNGKPADVNGGSIEAAWIERNGIPEVRLKYRLNRDKLEVTEQFFCPNRTQPRLVREVRLKNPSSKSRRFTLETGIKNHFIRGEMTVEPGGTGCRFIRYDLKKNGRTAETAFFIQEKGKFEISRTAGLGAAASFSMPMLDRLFNAARFQLPAVISRTGKVDASIWQYNREWVRDQAMMVIGLVHAGCFQTARVMLGRLFREFVTDKGDTVDSGCLRRRDEVELDQNGELLLALWNYVLWSGDRNIILSHWDKIQAAADFPLKPDFRHEASGLLANRREYWERHGIHGIEEGMELAYQLFVSIGLKAAAETARLISHKKKAFRWEREAARLRKIMLEHPRFALMDSRGFIKRRHIDGTVREEIHAGPEAGLPEGVPLAAKRKHFLNPDTSAVLPIAWNFVPADSPAASFTLAQVETLWNQNWKGGGYGRYHVSSEPDSPGPWPFASLFIARAAMEAEKYGTVRRIFNWLDSLDRLGSGTFFEYYGERLAPPFPQVGVPPWTWAELLLLFVRHMMGILPGPDSLRIRPRLLPGMERLEAEIPFRQGKIVLDIKRKPGIKPAVFQTASPVLSMDDSEVRLKVSEEGETFVLEAIVP